jgi:hypothetical protein
MSNRARCGKSRGLYPLVSLVLLFPLSGFRVHGYLIQPFALTVRLFVNIDRRFTS